VVKSKGRAQAAIKKPSRSDLAAAYGKRVPDVIARGLKILFVGINPGLYSGAVGHHFARPGNRFWPALYASRITPRLLSPFEERDLLQFGVGITNIVNRASAEACELSQADLRSGARRLENKIRRYRPRCVAFLGMGAYRTAFGRPKAVIGKQEEKIASSVVWLPPNPSGLNAHFQADDFARLFKELKIAATGGPSILDRRVR
jgi:TDG/mug DNA glycosylase family protein